VDVLAARDHDELSAIVWWWLAGTGDEHAAAAVNLTFTGLKPDLRYRWEMYAIDDVTSNFNAGEDKKELTVVASGQVPEGSRDFSLDASLPLYAVQMIRVIPQ
jgi:hypothetical protein